LANRGEEELRRIGIESRILEQKAEVLQYRLNMINTFTADLGFAVMALEGLEKEKENAELLVPIGGTSYVKVKLGNPDKIIVGMGAGVSAERTSQEAKDIIKKRLEDGERARMTIQQQLSQVAEEMNKNRERFETLAATMREGKTS
jgi:prefoldin alpha subunit